MKKQSIKKNLIKTDSIKENLVEADPIIKQAEKRNFGKIKIGFDNSEKSEKSKKNKNIVTDSQSINAKTKSNQKIIAGKKDIKNQEKAKEKDLLTPNSDTPFAFPDKKNQEISTKNEVSLVVFQSPDSLKNAEDFLEEVIKEDEEEELKKIEEERSKVNEQIGIEEKKLTENHVPEKISSYIPEKVELTFFDFNIPKICPLCNSKIKKKKVIQNGNSYNQEFECKNKKCKWEKEVNFKI